MRERDPSFEPRDSDFTAPKAIKITIITINVIIIVIIDIIIVIIIIITIITISPPVQQTDIFRRGNTNPQ